MLSLTLNRIKKSIESKGYTWLDDGKDYNLNIVGVRTVTTIPNKFDDFITISWKEKGIWNFVGYKCTTDPGSYWLSNPENVNGTAILVPGQYLNTWQLDLHQGKYKALCQ